VANWLRVRDAIVGSTLAQMIAIIAHKYSNERKGIAMTVASVAALLSMRL
jgi:hypothetical protein